MKDFTFGTLIACLALAFLAGFITCHKLYDGFDLKEKFNDSQNKHSSGR